MKISLVFLGRVNFQNFRIPMPVSKIVLIEGYGATTNLTKYSIRWLGSLLTSIWTANGDPYTFHESVSQHSPTLITHIFIV